MNFGSQLCWNCQRAIGKCKWSQTGEPIEGWDAEKVIINDIEGKIHTYKIKKCPLFVPDDVKRKKTSGSEINIREFAEIIKMPYEKIRRKKDEVLVGIARNHGIKISIIRSVHRKILIEEAE